MVFIFIIFVIAVFIIIIVIIDLTLRTRTSLRRRRNTRNRLLVMVGRKYFCTIICSRYSRFTRPALSWVELSASRRSAFEAKPTTHPNIENVLNLTCVGLHAPLPRCSSKGQQNFLFILNGLLKNIYQKIKLFVYLFDFSTTKRFKFNVIHVLCNRIVLGSTLSQE